MFYKSKFNTEILIKTGVHFGHKKNLWNPKMKKYIYGIKKNFHIIDIRKTELKIYNALKVVFTVICNGGKILFVNNKLNSRDITKNEATKCSQYYINHRWIGGMLTNWETIFNSISRLKHYQKSETNINNYTKKESIYLRKKKEKLNRLVGGIKELEVIPNIIFVVDIKAHAIAIKEAKKLGILVVGVVDTNSNPEDIDFVIPGNDDSRTAINLYCKLISDTVMAAKRFMNIKI